MRTIFQGAYHLIEGQSIDFEDMTVALVKQLVKTVPINRGRWQAEDVSQSDSHSTHELSNVNFIIRIPNTKNQAKLWIRPDLPWAEDHFLERVGGEPLNPAPSYVDWPYHSQAERDRHLKASGGTQFDHTYPERMWPKNAVSPTYPMYHHTNDRCLQVWGKNRGIRFDYGDLGDVVKQLKTDPFTRQAFLPIFFPEDTGATQGQRVPCTIGYHFIRRGMQLDCNYFIRSCDIYRHFRNDVYLAMRLTQWVVEQLDAKEGFVWPGNLNMFVSNLHLFKGDRWKFNGQADTTH